MLVSKTVEQYKSEQEERISRSKVYGDGTTSVPHGIVDVLFIDGDTGKISKYSGSESNQGRVLILLPFRTPRNLTKFASYAQPSEWKLKFSRGMMVNAVIENGYIKKLIPSYQFMPSAKVLDPESLETVSAMDSPVEDIPELRPKKDYARAFEDESTSAKPAPVPVGFEEEEENPF